jgi:hypothetical protein
MKAALLGLLLLASPSLAVAPPPVALTIRADPNVSADSVAICVVRAWNLSARTLLGRDIVFEARALEHGLVAETECGRFGGSLAPGASVETLIGFSGPFREFQVSLASPGHGSCGKSPRRKAAGRKRRKGGRTR